MSKVAVITMGVKLDGEKGYTRFRYLCEFLVKKGYEVDLITTTFQHWEKNKGIWNLLTRKATHLESNLYMSRDIGKISI